MFLFYYILWQPGVCGFDWQYCWTLCPNEHAIHSAVLARQHDLRSLLSARHNFIKKIHKFLKTYNYGNIFISGKYSPRRYSITYRFFHHRYFRWQLLEPNLQFLQRHSLPDRDKILPYLFLHLVLYMSLNLELDSAVA